MKKTKKSPKKKTRAGPPDGNEPRASRPAMPKGYGLARVRSPQDLMVWKQAQRKLARSHNYWVATTRPDGRPHVMPVWGVWVEGAFCFGTSPSSRKARNLARNASMAVHLESGDDAVILEGRARRVRERALLAAIDEAYAAKYEMKVSTHPDAAVYSLRPRVAFAWRERDFNKKATRWRFDEGHGHTGSERATRGRARSARGRAGAGARSR